MTLEELILELEEIPSFVLAIDGMCASGKSTLASYLQQRLDAHVFHMDDFFLPMHKRTSERLLEPGGNVDYERFLETVLIPLSQKQTVYYQPFDCSVMQLNQTVQEISYHSRNIIEGSYALRPEFIPYYTHYVVLAITPKLQIERIKKRNPNQITQFQHIWIPLENKYFQYYHIYENYPVIHHITL